MGYRGGKMLRKYIPTIFLFLGAASFSKEVVIKNAEIVSILKNQNIILTVIMLFVVLFFSLVLYVVGKTQTAQKGENKKIKDGLKGQNEYLEGFKQNVEEIKTENKENLSKSKESNKTILEIKELVKGSKNEVEILKELNTVSTLLKAMEEVGGDSNKDLGEIKKKITSLMEHSEKVLSAILEIRPLTDKEFFTVVAGLISEACLLTIITFLTSFVTENTSEETKENVVGFLKAKIQTLKLAFSELTYNNTKVIEKTNLLISTDILTVIELFKKNPEDYFNSNENTKYKKTKSFITVIKSLKDSIYTELEELQTK